MLWIHLLYGVMHMAYFSEGRYGLCIMILWMDWCGNECIDSCIMDRDYVLKSPAPHELFLFEYEIDWLLTFLFLFSFTFVVLWGAVLAKVNFSWTFIKLSKNFSFFFAILAWGGSCNCKGRLWLQPWSHCNMDLYINLINVR